MRFTRLWPVALCTAALVAGCSGAHGAVPENAANALVRVRDNPTPMWTVTFRYDPNVGSRTFVVPQNISQVTVTLQGAQGSNALGGVLQATIPVTASESLGVVVGGQGLPNGTGGFNGGGNGGGMTGPCCQGYAGGGGGGASDVRSGGMALQNRILVAGGGGGSSGGGWPGGAGGGTKGTDGAQSPQTGKGAGGGGTQAQGGQGAGGSNGALEDGGTGQAQAGSRFGGGGGGGGYYGGGGGRSSDSGGQGLDVADSGGGGGSGYAETTATGVTQTSGAGYGDGVVQITWPQQISTKLFSLTGVRNLAVDGRGDIFYASGGPSVTEVDIGGTTTQIGSGFAKATAVAVDSVGRVFVADSVDQTIWRVEPPFTNATHGTVKSIVQGVGPNLYAVAVDNHDNIYLGEGGSGYGGSIVEFDKSGKNMNVLAAKTFRPISVAVDAYCNENCVVYYTDYIAYTFSSLRRLFKISGTGKVSQVTNLPTNGPSWVAVDALGNAYVADIVNNAVAYVPVGGVPQKVGKYWNGPAGIAVPPSCAPRYSTCPIYVSESGAADILEVR